METTSGTYAVNRETGEYRFKQKGKWISLPPNHVARNPNTGQVLVKEGRKWKLLPTPSAGLVADFAKSTATGIGEGAAMLGGLPKAVMGMQRQGQEAAYAAQRDPRTDPRTQEAIAAVTGMMTGSGDMPASPPPTNIEEALPSYGDLQRRIFRDAGVPHYTPSTNLGRTYQSAISGATMGAVGGVPGALAGASGMAAQQQAAEMGLPEWAQVAAGFAGPSAASALRGAVRGTGRMMAPFTQRGQKVIAAGKYSEAATNPEFQPRQAPIPGTRLTTGQATNDPGLIALERAAVMRTPAMQGKAKEMQTGGNRAVLDELNQLGYPAAGEATIARQAASTRVKEELQQSYNAAKTREKNAWNAVDPPSPQHPQGIITLPMRKIRYAWGAFKSGLTVSRAEKLPGTVEATLNKLTKKYGGNVPLNEIKDLRSVLLRDARKARQAGDGNLDNILSDAAEVFRKYMDDIQLTDPAAQVRLDAARAATRELHATFDDPAVKQVLGKTSGFDKVAGSEAADRFLKSGKPEGLNSYIKATGGSPDAMTAGRDYIVARLKQAAESRVLDQQNNPLLNAGAFRKFINDNRALIRDGRLFTQEQQAVLDRAADTLDVLARTSRGGMPGGSDTYAKMASEKFLETIVGKKATVFLETAGMLAGYATFGLVGAIGGFGAGRQAALALYRGAQNKVLDIVDRMVLDPDFAKEIMTFRQAPSPKTLTQNVAAALGLTSAMTVPQMTGAR